MFSKRYSSINGKKYSPLIGCKIRETLTTFHLSWNSTYISRYLEPVLYTYNVRGFSWNNAVRVLCPLSTSDIMSVIIGCHADMSTNFRNDLGHFLCPGQSN